MRKSVPILVLAFFALVAGAWFALRPPDMTLAPVPTAATGTSGPEARAAAVATAPKLGTSAVLAEPDRRSSRPGDS